jgi:hypothetical protein
VRQSKRMERVWEIRLKLQRFLIRFEPHPDIGPSSSKVRREFYHPLISAKCFPKSAKPGQRKTETPVKVDIIR